MIRLYCVGIHFRKDIVFIPDALGEILGPDGNPAVKRDPITNKPNKDAADMEIPVDPDNLMSGYKILEMAAQLFDLRYKLTAGPPVYPLFGHVAYVGYTPKKEDDPKPRVTFQGAFPFYGQPLSLTEVLAPIGQPSQVLQYTVQYGVGQEPLPAGSSRIPKTRYSSGPIQLPTPAQGEENPNVNPDTPISLRGESQFAVNGFPNGCEIRIRSLNIFCTS